MRAAQHDVERRIARMKAESQHIIDELREEGEADGAARFADAVEDVADGMRAEDARRRAFDEHIRARHGRRSP